MKTLRWLLAAAVLPPALLAVCCGSGTAPVVENACLQLSPTGQSYNPGAPGDNGAPEIPTGFVTRKVATSRSFMVVAANPLATKAGCDMFEQGGTAIDAAIAVQMVLNLVEPQSSGIGGGAFLMHYNSSIGTVTAYEKMWTPIVFALQPATKSGWPLLASPCTSRFLILPIQKVGVRNLFSSLLEKWVSSISRREYVRLLRGLKPKVFVMENVSGMVKGKMKLIFAEIMRELKASGYHVSARLMNAMYFGVPQSRQRMIFIGVREDLWNCIQTR